MNEPRSRRMRRPRNTRTDPVALYADIERVDRTKVNAIAEAMDMPLAVFLELLIRGLTLDENGQPTLTWSSERQETLPLAG